MNTLRKRDNDNDSGVTFGSLFDRFLTNNLGRLFDDEDWGFKGLRTNMNVPVNIREDDKSYELEVVAPGLKKEDFKIDVSNNMLTVKFEHETEKKQEDEKKGWLRREYSMQSFSRSFTLDDSVDVDKIDASYKDGMLRMTLPKKEQAKKLSKNISVK